MKRPAPRNPRLPNCSPSPTRPAASAGSRNKIAPELWRRHVSVPGILAPSVEQRWAEFGYPCFSPYAIELVCFDLRQRVPHTFTLDFSQDTPSAQDAIDRELVRHYRPHSPRNGSLIRLLQESADRERAAPPAPLPPGMLRARSLWIFFPQALRDIIEERWRELGYESLSAYVTGLIRYDLMLSGPHHYFNGNDTDPNFLALLDRETRREFQKAGASPRTRKVWIDFTIEEIVGRKLSAEERDAKKAEIAQRLKERALKAQAEERRRGWS